MVRTRQRDANDRDYFVFLVDGYTTRRVSVGRFYGRTAEQAIEMARARYPKLFAGSVGRNWRAQATEVKP